MFFGNVFRKFFSEILFGNFFQNFFSEIFFRNFSEKKLRKKFRIFFSPMEVFDSAVFSRFGSEFNLRNRPNSHRTVLRGPQNWFTGVPARKKVLGTLLKCPKTPQNHYGTGSWGPEGTLGPAKSNFFENPNFHRFPAKFALPNARAGARGVFLQPQNPSPGVPAGEQVPGCLLQCPRTPHNHYGTPPWGPLGTLGPAKPKKIADFTRFGACGQLEDNGDGTYTRIVKGNAIIKINKITKGKGF